MINGDIYSGRIRPIQTQEKKNVGYGEFLKTLQAATHLDVFVPESGTWHSATVTRLKNLKICLEVDDGHGPIYLWQEELERRCAPYHSLSLLPSYSHIRFPPNPNVC